MDCSSFHNFLWQTSRPVFSCVSCWLEGVTSLAKCCYPGAHKLRWRVFARGPVEQTPARDPAVSWASWWAPNSVNLWGSLYWVLEPALHSPTGTASHAVLPWEPSTRSDFRETSPTKSSHTNSAPQWVDLPMYQIHGYRVFPTREGLLLLLHQINLAGN